MKTEFPILFVDDHREFVDSLIPPSKTWLEENGFELVVKFHKSESGVIEDLRNSEIELVVVDYRLAGNKMGDDVIKEIRGKEFYQDIVFYSQVELPEDVLRMHLDGVFYAIKADARDIIKRLIELKLRRATDLATFRGWIIADTIELETMLGRVLAKCFGKHEDLFMERVMKEEVFDLGRKCMVLSGIVKDRLKGKSAAEAPELHGCKEILNEFVENIIVVRNTLAHQMHETGDSEHKIVKTRTNQPKPIILTDKKRAEIRRDIRKHRQNLIELGELLQA